MKDELYDLEHVMYMYGYVLWNIYICGYMYVCDKDGVISKYDICIHEENDRRHVMRLRLIHLNNMVYWLMLACMDTW